MRKAVSLLLPLCIAAYSADLPVKNVVLYKHGVGYFERVGEIAAGQDARLDFNTSDMNDVLKSLTVTDCTGTQVSGVRYDSNETLQQQLAEFPFHIDQSEKLSAFLDSLRGAHLEIKTKDGTQAGNIVSARAEATTTIMQEQLTLLLDSGELANFELAQISSFRLTDPLLQQKLKRYLAVVAAAQAKDKRSVYIDSVGSGARNLQVSYVAPVAIWKSSYRLTLADTKSTLEGWAIVDNTTDEDWNSVALSVVSGRPISFISLLDTPRFGHRQVAELPEDQAAGPEVYGGTVSGSLNSAVTSTKREVFNGRAAMQTSSMSPPAPLNQPSTVQGAAGETLGELFEYNFASPVSIKRNQSAMLPFLKDKIAARKLLIYKETDGEHPVNAAELTNTSGKTLDGGPLTVYDSGAYAGEALVETLKAGDKRMIGYAVDYGTRVTTRFESGESNLLDIHARSGVLQLRSSRQDTRTYQVRNVDAKAKTMIVQQDEQNGYTLISPKPAEITSSAYRFQVSVPANGDQTLRVEQEHVNTDEVVVGSATTDGLVEIVAGQKLSQAGRTQLEAVIALKRKLADVTDERADAKVASEDLTADETRLRQNIDSLNKVSGQEDKVRQYSSLLNENEVKLAQLRDKINALNSTVDAVTKQLANSIATLEF